MESFGGLFERCLVSGFGGVWEERKGIFSSVVDVGFFIVIETRLFIMELGICDV